MVNVREEEESLVKRLLLGEDKSDDSIQRKLDKIFTKSRPEVAQVVGQNYFNSRSSLMVARSRNFFGERLEGAIKTGQNQDSRWVDRYFPTYINPGQRKDHREIELID